MIDRYKLPIQFFLSSIVLCMPRRILSPKMLSVARTVKKFKKSIKYLKKLKHLQKTHGTVKFRGIACCEFAYIEYRVLRIIAVNTRVANLGCAMAPIEHNESFRSRLVVVQWICSTWDCIRSVIRTFDSQIHDMKQCLAKSSEI